MELESISIADTLDYVVILAIGVNSDGDYCNLLAFQKQTEQSELADAKTPEADGTLISALMWLSCLRIVVD